MSKTLRVILDKKTSTFVEKMHRLSGVSKSRIVEWTIDAASRDSDTLEALRLIKAVENAEKDFQEGRTRRWEDVKREIESRLKRAKKEKRS